MIEQSGKSVVFCSRKCSEESLIIKRSKGTYKITLRSILLLKVEIKENETATKMKVATQPRIFSTALASK